MSRIEDSKKVNESKIDEKKNCDDHFVCKVTGKNLHMSSGVKDATEEKKPETR